MSMPYKYTTFVKQPETSTSRKVYVYAYENVMRLQNIVHHSIFCSVFAEFM